MSTALLATRPPVPLSLYSDLDPQADEIRLLLLSPAPCTVPTVSCELLTVSLKDRPIYDALSYVWGDPKITRPIRVNGQVAQVTVNLEAALRRIQQPDYQVRVWVDAVCVNQRDESERSSQVAFMKEIYSNARMVYAWLGEEGERSLEAFALIRDWTAGIEDNPAKVPHLRIYDQPTGNLWLDGLLEKLARDVTGAESLLDDRRLDAVTRLSERGYWSRIWIQQELFLAKRVIVLCGRDTISFSRLLVFYATIKHIQNKLTTAVSIPRAIGAPAPPIIFYTGATYFDILDCVNIFRSCQSSDPRDKLYGILGMLDSDSVSIQVDYQARVSDVYANFVRSLADKTGVLYIDGSNGIGGWHTDYSRIADLPSWAPDLRAVGLNFGRDSEGRAAGALRSVASWSVDLKALESPGLIVDRVTSVSATLDGDGERIAETLREFVLANLDAPMATDVPVLQAFLRTVLQLSWSAKDTREPVADFELATIDWMSSSVTKDLTGLWHPKFVDFWNKFDLKLAQMHPSLIPSLRFLAATGLVDHLYEPCETYGGIGGLSQLTENQHMAGFWGNTTETPTSNLQVPTPDLFKIYLQAHCQDGTLFMTGKGYIGLGEYQPDTGDLIVILPGCPYPLVVRPLDDHHKVVGSVCIYGMMDGEIVRDLSPGDEAEWPVSRFK